MRNELLDELVDAILQNERRPAGRFLPSPRSAWAERDRTEGGQGPGDGRREPAAECSLDAQAERLGLDAGMVWRLGRPWGSTGS